MDDIQVGVHYDEPVQGGEEKVTRQRGLDPQRLVGVDPTPPPPIVQGDHEVVATRQVGNGAQRFDLSGTLLSDSVADDSTVLYVDRHATAIGGEPNQPPGIARTAMPLPPPPGFGDMPAVEQRAAIKAQAEAMGFVVSDVPGVPPTTGVMQADSGAVDPRDASVGPQVLGADQLPVVRKAPIVPVVISKSGVVQVARAKKAGKK